MYRVYSKHAKKIYFRRESSGYCITQARMDTGPGEKNSDQT